MFEELKRELRRLDGTHRLPVSVPTDGDGYLDRACPAARCEFEFKVHEEDWRDTVRDEEVFCPFCGHSADSAEWMTPEQVKHVRAAAVAHVRTRIGAAMKRDARRWNRRQPRNSFISLTIKVDDRPRRVVLPAAAAEPMRLKISCPACACRYAVIGAAFFCPACGHNAAVQVFSQSLAGIRGVLDSLEIIRSAVADRDTAATTSRLIIEGALQNAVTVFQRYAEALHAGFPATARPRRNAFQNLSEGSELWGAATGKVYVVYLDAAELTTLTRYFQQRHLLAHKQGLVDADYLAHTGDSSYRMGQRLVVSADDVRNCVALVEKLATGMAADS